MPLRSGIGADAVRVPSSFTVGGLIVERGWEPVDLLDRPTFCFNEDDDVVERTPAVEGNEGASFVTVAAAAANEEFGGGVKRLAAFASANFVSTIPGDCKGETD